MQLIEWVLTGEQKMHCAGCETRVAYALRQLPGVREVRASARNQHVVVVLDRTGANAAEQIGEKLKQLGYEARLLESPSD